MKKITHFTGNKVDEFRSELSTFLKSFESRHGVAVNLGSMTYRSDQLTTKMTVTVVKEGVNPEEAMNRQSIKEHGWRYDLTESDFNKEIAFMGKLYSLKGVKKIKQKFPIIVEKMSTGEMFRLPSTCLK